MVQGEERRLIYNDMQIKFYVIVYMEIKNYTCTFEYYAQHITACKLRHEQYDMSLFRWQLQRMPFKHSNYRRITISTLLTNRFRFEIPSVASF